MNNRALFLAGLLLALPAAAEPRIPENFLSFPPGFQWCVATAAHQIEGGNTESDWWDWEQVPGHIKRGETSGAACDHWNRVVEDTLLMKRLGVQTYRFSVEWAKIEPREGEIDLAAVLHYQAEILALRLAGIQPMITLHHFTFPRWVRAHGGWEWEGTPRAFSRFAELVYTRIAPGTRDWITINEPMVHLTLGYLGGLVPPGQTDVKKAVAPFKGMLQSHAAAYAVLHREAAALGEPVRVGLAHHLRVFDPKSKWNPLDRFLAKTLDGLFNWAFVDAIETGRMKLKIPFTLKVDEEIPGLKGTQDFFGLNYYTRDIIQFKPGEPLFAKMLVKKGAPVNDMGWELYPEGFYRLLTEVHRRYPRHAVLITENGTADAKDAFRPEFLKAHLAQLHRAIQDGVTVESYCHWSLMDNFEWIEGFAPRFGLYETHYETQERTLRPSGELFRRISRDNGVWY